MDLDQKAFLLDHLKKSGEGFEAAVASTGPIWLESPGEGQWSIGQCAEHVVSVEQRIQARVEKLAELEAEAFDDADRERKDRLVLSVANRETKVQAPAAVHPAAKYPGLEEMLKDFRKAHSGLIRLAEGYPSWLRGRFVEHPVLKKLDGHQWILTASCHAVRHTAQIEEIKRHFSA